MSNPQFTSLMLEKHGKVHVVTLNRPDKKNALDKTLREELVQVLDFLARDLKTQAVVLYGGQQVFCAGFDKTEVAGLIQKGTPQEAQAFAEDTIRFQEAILHFPKVLIAAIAGHALGGGFDLAVLCHLRVAAESALFGHPEIGFGACPLFFPYYGLVGRGKALELTLDTASPEKFINAGEAYRLGLINKVSKPETLLQDAISLAKSIGRAPDFAISLLLRVSTFAFDPIALNRKEIEFVAAETTRILLKIRETPPPHK